MGRTKSAHEPLPHRILHPATAGRWGGPMTPRETRRLSPRLLRHDGHLVRLDERTLKLGLYLA